MLETIRHNSRGYLVTVAKYLTGYCERGRADDNFDATFVAYVCSWQGKNGLTADGIIGQKSWAKLAESAPTCSTAKNKTSAATCAVQLLVGDLTVDGVYGTKTKKAVAAFQSAKGLSADGICGPRTWAALVGVEKANSGAAPATGEGTGAGQTVSGGKVINNCVHYLQWDSRWKNIKYSTHTSSQTIGNSGCGPSAMAQIMATFIDKNITPVEMAALAQANGYRTYSSGTAWDFYEFVFKRYPGFSKFVKSTSVPTLKAALEQGALAVCSMNSNDNHFWTSGGHFITAIGYDDAGYIYANDPNKQEHPRKQKQDKFKSCLKQAFIFWPEAKEAALDPFDEAGESIEPYIIDVPVDIHSPGNAQAQSVKVPTDAVEPPVPEVDAEIGEDGGITIRPIAEAKAIIDISKHDGDIDFATLKQHVSLVIARCSLGSDLDVRFDSYAEAMNREGIPFGVYCYSYARDKAKAWDEAARMLKYAAKYDPLFYVIDAEEDCVTQETLRTFVEALRSFGAGRVGCYVAHHLYNTYQFGEIAELFDFVWIPRYGKNDGTLEGSTMPKYPCDLWQYTSQGHIPGINKTEDVDLNIITGVGHDLEWFLKGGE